MHVTWIAPISYRLHEKSHLNETKETNNDYSIHQKYIKSFENEKFLHELGYHLL